MRPLVVKRNLETRATALILNSLLVDKKEAFLVLETEASRRY